VEDLVEGLVEESGGGSGGGSGRGVWWRIWWRMRLQGSEPWLLLAVFVSACICFRLS
jgi:hypothetical protein